MSARRLPHFVETFMDNGYYDMSKIMTALVEVKFDGIVILDHTPRWWAAISLNRPTASPI